MLTPSEVAELQLQAYNAKNIDQFMSYWHPEAEYYVHPNSRLARGLDEIRTKHLERFLEADLYGELIHRTQIDNRVIDHELVTRNFPEGKGSVEVICIYEVQEEKIRKAWFILGNKKSESMTKLDRD